MALVTSLLTGCSFGVAPALRLSRLSLTELLKPVSGLASKQRARLRSALLVLQVAAAVTLLVLAGLVLQTFLTLFPSSAGFATESRSAFIWHVTDRQFPDASDRRRRVKDWMERLTAVPGVVAVATASGMPFGDDEPTNTAVRRPEDANPPDKAAVRSDLRAVSLNYFQLLQVRLIQGRHFAPTDRAEAPRVALVNQTLARRLELSGDVVGRSIRVGNAANSPIVQIVGVVADTRWWGMTLDPLNEVYVPLDQHSASFGFLIVHSTLGVAELTAAIKRTFYAALPGAAVLAERQAVPLDDMIAGSGGWSPVQRHADQRLLGRHVATRRDRAVRDGCLFGDAAASRAWRSRGAGCAAPRSDHDDDALGDHADSDRRRIWSGRGGIPHQVRRKSTLRN